MSWAPGADYPYISVHSRIQFIEHSIRAAVNPYLGRVSSPRTEEDVRSDVQRTLDNLISWQYIYSGDISAADDGIMRVGLMLSPGAECINLALKLTTEGDAIITVTDWPANDSAIMIKF